MKKSRFKVLILLRGHAEDGPVMDLVNRLACAGISDINFLELRDTCSSQFHSTRWLFYLRSLLRMTSNAFISAIINIELSFLKCKHKKEKGKMAETPGSIYPSRKIIQVHRKISSDGKYIRMCDVKAIACLGADLLVQIDGPTPPSGISAAGKFGLLALMYGPNMHENLPRPGFWASYYRKNKTEFQIRHYQHGEDTGNMTLHGSFATKLLFSENQKSLLCQSNAQLALIILRIRRDSALLPIREERAFDFSQDQAPNLLFLLIYMFKSAYRMGCKFSRRGLNIKQKWALALSAGSWSSANDNNAIKFEPPKGKFWADPFLFKERDQLYCFVEEYSYKIKKGHISVLSIDNGKVMELGCCIEKPFHLSFPYIFRYNGHIYMCPEASESKKITIYRSEVFPLKWHAHSIAMENVSAVDTMIFEFEEKWWMFTNIDTSGISEHGSALYIFYSETPLNGNWTAHAMNPIIVDSRGGRNGGLIIQEGRIFRGAQVQGYDQYGQGIIVSEIVTLNESDYMEIERKEFGPRRKAGIVGVHHISSAGNMTIVDQLTDKFRA